jgi:hypothetical protein
VVLKCGVGEGLERSMGPIAWEIEEVLTELSRRGIFYEQRKEGMLTGSVKPSIGIVF